MYFTVIFSARILLSTCNLSTLHSPKLLCENSVHLIVISFSALLSCAFPHFYSPFLCSTELILLHSTEQHFPMLNWVVPFHVSESHTLFCLTELYLFTFHRTITFSAQPSYTSSMFHRAIPFSAVLNCHFTLFTDQHLSLLNWVVPFTRSTEPTSFSV